LRTVFLKTPYHDDSTEETGVAMAANSEPEAQVHMVSQAQGEGQFKLRYPQSKVEEANHVAWYQEACSCS